MRIELERNDMMKAASKQGMSKVDAQAWVFAERDRLHPPQKADIVRFGGRKSDQTPRGSVGLLVLYALRTYLRNRC